MINGVKIVKTDKGTKFIINDSLVVFDLDVDEKGIKYKVNYDENVITEGEANEIAVDFVEQALLHYSKTS